MTISALLIPVGFVVAGFVSWHFEGHWGLATMCVALAILFFAMGIGATAKDGL
jgi:hypothetical protein